MRAAGRQNAEADDRSSGREARPSPLVQHEVPRVPCRPRCASTCAQVANPAAQRRLRARGQHRPRSPAKSPCACPPAWEGLPRGDTHRRCSEPMAETPSG